VRYERTGERDAVVREVGLVAGTPVRRAFPWVRRVSVLATRPAQLAAAGIKKARLAGRAKRRESQSMWLRTTGELCLI